jgi:hypothetical protein
VYAHASNNNTATRSLNEQFYELGRLLGKHLTVLESPTFAQCMTIGLPEHQTNADQPITGDLDSLLGLIQSLNSESSYIIEVRGGVVFLSLIFQKYWQTGTCNSNDVFGSSRFYQR